MTRRSGRRIALTLVLLLGLVGLPGLSLATRALQSGEIFAPASGHAQVIAQGVAALPEQAAWRTVFYSVPPGNPVELPAAGPGFILVDTGGVLTDDDGAAKMLAPTEATFHDDSSTRLTPVGERPAGLFAIDVVSADAAGDAGDGIPVFASEAFDAPAGVRDMDLVRDLLEPGESTTVIGNEAPVLLLVTLGAVRIEATDGSAASLRVGEAATFVGDIVLTAEGQAPSTFVAAVIGREVSLASGTSGATPQPAAIGSVQVTVYACPPLVMPEEASPGRCLRDPEAVSLELVSLSGEPRDVGPSTERQGLPTWTGLAGGEYALRASAFQEGFGRFLVRGLEGIDGNGSAGYPAGEAGGYLIPISADAADYALEVFVLGPGDGATPAVESTPEPVVEEAATPAGPTEIPSVIQIETAVPGAPTPTPRARPTATATPRPDPITRATVQPTERPILTSTAVARPRRGTVTVRVWGCPDSIDTFDPADCVQAVEGFDVHLISEGGDVIDLSDATIDDDGSLSWKNLSLGTYTFQQPVMLSEAVTYYAPDLTLAPDSSGYIISIDADEPIATVDVYNLPGSTTALAPTVAPGGPADSDDDGITDVDEVEIYGTDPLNTDTDFDGVFDGAELVAGTDPLVADSVAAEEPSRDGDSDGDRLSDGDEAAFGTDPGSPDSDGDGYFDGDEVNLGTDPLDSSSVPAG